MWGGQTMKPKAAAKTAKPAVKSCKAAGCHGPWLQVVQNQAKLRK